MSPGRAPTPPNGSRPSSGDVDFGTGKYFIAGVQASSKLTSETLSVGGSICATTGDFAALAEDDAGVAEDVGAVEDEDCVSLDAGSAELETGVADDTGAAED